jgi:hypothetical protein
MRIIVGATLWLGIGAGTRSPPISSGLASITISERGAKVTCLFGLTSIKTIEGLYN